MKFTGNISVWLSDPAYKGQQLKDALDRGDHDAAVDAFNISAADMSEYGWARAGTAQVTVDLLDDSAILAGTIASLRAQRKKILAEAHASATKIDGEIQSLLAIENNLTVNNDEAIL